MSRHNLSLVIQFTFGEVLRNKNIKKEDKYIVQVLIVPNRHRIIISSPKQPLQMQQALHSTKTLLETLI